MKLEDLRPRPFEEREEGIFEMEDQLYRAAPGLSQSMLKVLMPPGSCDSARSAAHFQTQLKQPPEPPGAASGRMLRGPGVADDTGRAFT